MPKEDPIPAINSVLATYFGRNDFLRIPTVLRWKTFFLFPSLPSLLSSFCPFLNFKVFIKKYYLSQQPMVDIPSMCTVGPVLGMSSSTLAGPPPSETLPLFHVSSGGSGQAAVMNGCAGYSQENI